MESTLTITLANELSEIARAQTLVEEFGTAHEVASDVIHAFTLCLEEIVSNIIRHGYDEGERRPIDLRLSIGGGRMVLEVADTGRPFNPLDQADPDTDIPLEERQIGGLGIYLVKNMMDEFEYRRQKNKNILVMTKRF